MGAQHTPGPWRVGADLRAVCVDWRNEAGTLSRDATTVNGWAKNIAKIPHGSWASVTEHVANARLIAAAPEMLAALEAIERAPAWGAPERWDTTPAEVRLLARAAIAKALGESA